ncbi:MFS quinate transporter, putative [Penicillium digitatum PHI26]|uniref:MFS quinate transporter, putative n=2 Tax=Penicillium digitatum TaxID=36651 RepID=K9FML8_PEND2|nr:MFS quinate transporter, putative [Penicillium digitatum Pd1]EKV09070.1 MFS quinate transporter, putative [Penicillium digitatum Pd1]EKV10474.1 MFS quinate transporter, putative [Penicillium digitatum PHI26]
MQWITSRWSTNPYCALVIAVIACGGIPKVTFANCTLSSKGYDEGGYSASVSLPSFKSDYNLDKHMGIDDTELANRKANISSFNVLGAALGALIVLDLNDRLGRLVVWRLACIVHIRPQSNQWCVIAGFFINYGARVHMATTRAQYRLVQAVPLIPVGVAYGLSHLCPETPRYLVSKHLHREGLEALARLRGRAIDDPEVTKEFASIDARERERATDLASVSHWAVFKETQTNPNYRQRFWLLMTMQTIAQWTGGNGITYYITGIFQYAGVKGDGNSLISSGVYGIVKLIFTMAFTWGLIDLLGRRRCTLAGLSLQLCAHIYMSTYMGLRPGSADNQNASNAAVASVFIYAVGWSIGLCTVPYLYGTEIFPTRIRNVSYAISMALHWFFQFAVVRVTPNMFVLLDVWGAYLFWALICFSGLVIFGMWMPETKGVPIERMGDLFDGPWYLRWRARPREWDLVSPADISQNVASKDGRVLKSGDLAL